MSFMTNDDLQNFGHFEDRNIDYVIRSCILCHGGSHASGACLNGNLHTKSIVFKWSLVHDHYQRLYLMWPTSVFVRECGLNLADAIMQRSMSHFGRCRYCYSGALLSESGHCCPFRVRAPVDFLHGRPVIGLRGFVLCQGVTERWPLTCHVVICNRCHFRKYPCECQEM